MARRACGVLDISGLPELSRKGYLAREESLLKLLGPGADLPERSVIIELMDRSFEQLLAKNQAVYKAGDSGKDTPVLQNHFRHRASGEQVPGNRLHG